MSNRLDTLSSICGWSYFLAWSISFYPQPLLNLRRRSTKGLLIDYPLLNVVGFTFYTTSTSALLLSSTIRDQYASRHPSAPKPTVRLADLAFSCHALVLSLVTLSQFIPKLWKLKDAELDESVRIIPTRPVRWLISAAALSIAASVTVVLLSNDNGENGSSWQWLDVITVLSILKVILTITKYVPQAVSHVRLRSTLGFSILQVLLDTAGGIFSLTQLLLDAYGSGNGWQGVGSALTDNPGKLGLAGVSLFFDAVFVVQHYVLYGPACGVEACGQGESRPLLG